MLLCPTRRCVQSGQGQKAAAQTGVCDMDQLSASAASLEPTIIKAAGLSEPFRILRLTDLHLCECDERNAAEMDAVAERKITFPDALERFEEAIEWSRTVPFDL